MCATGSEFAETFREGSSTDRPPARLSRLDHRWLFECAGLLNRALLFLSIDRKDPVCPGEIRARARFCSRLLERAELAAAILRPGELRIVQNFDDLDLTIEVERFREPLQSQQRRHHRGTLRRAFTFEGKAIILSYSLRDPERLPDPPQFVALSVQSGRG